MMKTVATSVTYRMLGMDWNYTASYLSTSLHMYCAYMCVRVCERKESE